MKYQVRVIYLIITVFLYLIIHNRRNRETGKRISDMHYSDITECDVLYWSPEITEGTGITRFKCVNAGLWSVSADTLLNHVQEHEDLCVSGGCDVTQLPLKQWGGWKTLPCFNQAVDFIPCCLIEFMDYVSACGQIYAYIYRTSSRFTLFLKDKYFTALFSSSLMDFAFVVSI